MTRQQLLNKVQHGFQGGRMFGVLGVLAGIVLAAVGLFLVIFFPNVTEHQQVGYEDNSFTIAGVVMGVVFVIAGGVLIFL
jgi:hypothetical protein